MPALNPYLTFEGNCEEAFEFYRSIFGGEFTFVGRFSEMPDDYKKDMPEEALEKIMHMSLPIGDQVLMGSDTGGDWGAKLMVGNNMSLSVNADSKSDADHIFAKLSEGGEITMPMANTFWGDYFGMCLDKFGINWMVSYNEQAQQS